MMRNDRHGGRRLAMSRRAMLTTAAVGVGVGTVGVVGLAAASGNGEDSDDAIVVQVLDAKEGKLAIFVGEELIEVKDKGLASDLVKAAKKKKK